MKFIGKLITGDFEEKTMTFEIEGEMILQTGEYSITKIDCESEVKKLDLFNVSQQSDLLKAFIRWNNKHNGIAQPVPEKMADNYLKSL